MLDLRFGSHWEGWNLIERLGFISFLLAVFGLVLAIVPYFDDTSSKDTSVTSEPLTRYYSIEAMREEANGFNRAYLEMLKEIDSFIENEVKADLNVTPDSEWRFEYEVSLLNQDMGGLDLNNDGYPELVVEVPIFCGSGGCQFEIYSFDRKSKTINSIGSLPVSNYHLTGRTIEGWAVISGKWKMGACESIISLYTFNQGQYKEESSKTEKYC